MRKVYILFLVMLLTALGLYAQTPQWINGGGGIQMNQVKAMAIDKAGNTYVTGTYQGSATFGSAGLPAYGLTDMFVAKYGPKGNLIWIRGFGGDVYDEGHGLVLDGNGGLYVSGYFGDTVWFDRFVMCSIGNGNISLARKYKSLVGDEDALVLKMDTSGKVKWVKQGGNYDNDHVEDMAYDNKGNLYMTGTTGSDFTFLGDTFKNRGYYDLFTIKMDTSGKKGWLRQAGATGLDYGNSVTVDDSGYAYVYGFFLDSITVGKQTFKGRGSLISDGIIIKYDTKGNVVWAKPIYATLANKIRMYDNKTFYTIGNYKDSMTFNGKGIHAHGYYDSYIAKYDNTGKGIWVKNIYGYKSTTWTSMQDIAFDKTGNAYIGGVFLDSILFDNDTVGSKGKNDLFYASYDPSGNLGWLYPAGGTGNDAATSIGLDTGGNILAAGFFYGSITLGSVKMSGTNPAFLVKFSTCPNINADITVKSKLSLCPGDSTLLSVPSVSGLSYQWKMNGGAISSGTKAAYTAKKTGTYTVEVSDNSCTRTSKPVAISVFKIPVISHTAKVNFCSGDSTTLTGVSDTGVSWQWYKNGAVISDATKANLAIKATGIYKVRATSKTGCSDTSASLSIHVYTYPSAPYISYMGGLAICRGDLKTFSVTNTQGDTIRWYKNNTLLTSGRDSFYSPTETGNYTVELTTPAGCNSMSKSVYLNVNNVPDATVHANATICQGDSLRIGADSIAGNMYSWTSNPSGYTASVSNPFVKPSATTIYVLTETVRATGCSKSHAVTITVNPVPVANAGKDTTVCSGTSVNIGSSAAAGVKYSWVSNPSGFTSSLSSTSVAPSATTIYVLKAGYSTGCAAYDTVNVNIIPTPSLSNVSNSSPACEGTGVQLRSLASKGASYSWTGPNGFSSPLANPVISHLTGSDTGWYAVSASSGGCVSKAVKTHVSLLPAPTGNAGTGQSICSGASATIGSANVSGNVYNWTSKPAGYSSNNATASVKPVTTTTYYLSIYGTNGCSKNDSVTVTVNAKPVSKITLSGNAEFCEGGSATLQGPAGYTWQWLKNGKTDATTQNITASVSGSYSLVCTNTAQCADTSKAVKITVHALPAIPVISSRNDTLFSSYTIGNQWYKDNAKQAGETKNYIAHPATGAWYVMETDSFGCSAQSDNYSITRTGMVQQQNLKNPILLYPNPAKEVLYLQNQGTGRYSMEVYNAIGQRFGTGIVNGNSTSEMKLNGWPAGIYYIRLLDIENNTISVMRFEMQR